jgi:hypothetical protein
VIKNLEHAQKLSQDFDIPLEDILLIGINLAGVKAEMPDQRIRFKIKLRNLKEWFYMGICVNIGKTPFYIKKNNLYIQNEKIGKIAEVENDTCDTTYLRRNNTSINLNSNCRSGCFGCKFCGTYKQDADDKVLLLDFKKLENKFSCTFSGKVKNILEICLCTGCFKDEEEVIQHLLMIRNWCETKKIDPRIKYIGSQITEKKNLNLIQNKIPKFSYYLTIECFNRRNFMLRNSKARVSLEKAQHLMNYSTKIGLNTTFLYILGLDSISSISRHFKKYAKSINRFPIVNLMQIYYKGQEELRHKEADQIEYYLKARKIIEKIFIKSKLRPELWENYRGLWYTKFDKENLTGFKM